MASHNKKVVYNSIVWRVIRPCLRRFLSGREHLNKTGPLQQNEVSQLTYSSSGAYKPMDNPKNKSMDSPIDNPKNSPMNNSKDKTADKSTDKSKDKTAPRPDLLCVADKNGYGRLANGKI